MTIKDYLKTFDKKKYLFKYAEIMCEKTLIRREKNENGYGLNRFDESFLIEVLEKYRNGDIISDLQMKSVKKIVFKYRKQIMLFLTTQIEGEND
jgi:hypothetical protein